MKGVDNVVTYRPGFRQSLSAGPSEKVDQRLARKSLYGVDWDRS
jgi:hypothetical protein